MDHFTLIQHFFTRVQCPHCSSHITEEGVALLREEQGMYMVSIHCNQCDTHVGVAMVGVESAPSSGSHSHGMGSLSGRLHMSSGTGGAMSGAARKRRFKDPELTDLELDRLSAFSAITDDDVLEAHHFVDSLDAGWMKHVPAELREKFASDAIEADPLPPLPPELLGC